MNVLQKLFGSDDTQSTRIELARMFADLGGADLARDLLAEVVDEGNDDERRQAEDLLAEF